jgi:hypothetical protein
VLTAVKGAVSYYRAVAPFAEGVGLSVYFPSAQGGREDWKKKARGAAERTFDWPASFTLGFARKAPAGSEMIKYAPDLDPYQCKTEDPNRPRENAPGLALVKDTHWGQFLHRYYEPVAAAVCSPAQVRVGETVTCRASGSSHPWESATVGYTWDRDASVKGSGEHFIDDDDIRLPGDYPSDAGDAGDDEGLHVTSRIPRQF